MCVFLDIQVDSHMYKKDPWTKMLAKPSRSVLKLKSGMSGWIKYCCYCFPVGLVHVWFGKFASHYYVQTATARYSLTNMQNMVLWVVIVEHWSRFTLGKKRSTKLVFAVGLHSATSCRVRPCKTGELGRRERTNSSSTRHTWFTSLCF